MIEEFDGAELVLVAGCNGAGKSTFCGAFSPSHSQRRFRAVVLNPDLTTKKILEQRGYTNAYSAPAEVQIDAFIEASDKMMKQAEEILRKRQRVVVETVLSTDKYLPMVELVRDLYGSFVLIYVALNSPALAVTRVARRVAHGGHDVPKDKIVDRWRRSITNLGIFAGLSDNLHVYDNSQSDEKVRAVEFIAGKVKLGRLYPEVFDRERIPEITKVIAPLVGKG